MSAAESVVSLIQHYQNSIKKYHGNSSRIVHCINKLYSLPVTVQHLQDTGVGKTINSLRKSDGEVGEAARALVYKWKQMVQAESENEQESNTDVQAHYNGDSEEDQQEREEKRRRESASKSSEGKDHREPSRPDHSRNNKRKREAEHDQVKEKRHRSDRVDGMSPHSSSSNSINKRSSNGNDLGSEEEWTADRHSNGGINSEDENFNRNNYIKSERHSSEEKNAAISDDDTHREKSKKEKSSSHRHKSSSSTDKSKHSSSRQEHKESKSSSSSKHREEKSSSSGSSSRNEEGSKSKEKERKDKHKEKHKSKDEKRSKEKKDKKKLEEEDEDGVNSFSGKSFGEALGMMFPPEKSKKKSSASASASVSSPSKKRSKSSSSSHSEKKSHHKDNSHSPYEFQMEQEPSSSQLPPSIDVDEDFGLPTLNPNYKPLPQPNFYSSPPKRYQNDDDDLTNIMYSKVQRTKVYSGNKSGYTSVPSLFDLCTRILQENIDALEFTGGVPFDLLKPVLERANPDQLFTLEHYNPYLIEDTDMFWEYHCKKDFRTKKREEMETWREMYMRCREEREYKLKSLTANIAASSKAKALPVRKTQLAYIEGTVKPPRSIARKQAKFGTAHASTSSGSSKTNGPGLSSSFTGRSSSSASSGPAVSVPAPRGSSSTSHSSSSCKPKPKAPLMQKALQLIKYNRFKR